MLLEIQSEDRKNFIFFTFYSLNCQKMIYGVKNYFDKKFAFLKVPKIIT